MRYFTFTLLFLFSLNVYAETWGCIGKHQKEVTLFTRLDGSFSKSTQYDLNEPIYKEVCDDYKKKDLKTPEWDTICTTGVIENTYKIHGENKSFVVLLDVYTRTIPSFTHIVMDKINKSVLEQSQSLMKPSTYQYKCTITQ
jgi:hypothetical protein